MKIMFGKDDSSEETANGIEIEEWMDSCGEVTITAHGESVTIYREELPQLIRNLTYISENHERAGGR